MNAMHRTPPMICWALVTCAIAGLLGAGSARGLDPIIHVAWNEPGDPPELDVDYVVLTDPPASPEYPDVELRTGSLTWRIWSTDPDNPDNIGDIGVISSPHAQNFGVRILDDQDGPGARTVKAVLLDPQGEGSDENYSNLVDGSITGDLTGDLLLQQATGGEGGTASLAIEGSTLGNLAIPVVSYLEIGQDVTRELRIDEVVEGGLLETHGNIPGSVLLGDVRAGGRIWLLGGSLSGELVIITADCASMLIDGVLAGSVSITEMNGGRLNISGRVLPGVGVKITHPSGSGSTCDRADIDLQTSETSPAFQGSLHLGSGIPAFVDVELHQGLCEPGRIELYGNDVGGSLTLLNNVGGTIADGGTVSGTVILARHSEDSSGSASFAAVDEAGNIMVANRASLRGTIDIAGDMLGIILVGGSITPPAGGIWVGGELAGEVEVWGDIWGQVVQAGGGLSGDVVVEGDVFGEIIAGGDLTGTVTVYGEFSGNICAANMSAGAAVPPGVDVNFVLPWAQVCGWLIACLENGDCDDGSQCTNDQCVDHWCSHTHNTEQCPHVCPPTPARPPHIAPKNRYLSFNPTNVGAAVALRVGMTASEYFPDSVGVLRWVGDPEEVTGFNCGIIWRVVDEPLYRDWSADEVIHVGDCEIVPAATYAIQAVEMTGGLESTPLHIQTIARPGSKYWGDVVWQAAPGNGEWTPPNQVVNMDDVQAVVNGVERVNNPPDTWVDVHGEVPNGVLNIADVQFIVLAYKSNPYPFGDPAECGGERGEDGIGQAPPPSTAFSLVAGSTGTTDGPALVPVEVYVDSVADLAAYQVVLEVTGSGGGTLELARLFIDTEREDYVFGSVEGIALADEVGGRLGALAIDGGMEVNGPAYLGTFVYRQSNDARGTYEVRVRGGESFLLNSAAGIVPSSLGEGVIIEGETP